jgi:hypothetical protein
MCVLNFTRAVLFVSLQHPAVKIERDLGYPNIHSKTPQRTHSTCKKVHNVTIHFYSVFSKFSSIRQEQEKQRQWNVWRHNQIILRWCKSFRPFPSTTITLRPIFDKKSITNRPQPMQSTRSQASLVRVQKS